MRLSSCCQLLGTFLIPSLPLEYVVCTIHYLGARILMELLSKRWKDMKVSADCFTEPLRVPEAGPDAHHHWSRHRHHSYYNHRSHRQGRQELKLVTPFRAMFGSSLFNDPYAARMSYEASPYDCAILTLCTVSRRLRVWFDGVRCRPVVVHAIGCQTRFVIGRFIFSIICVSVIFCVFIYTSLYYQPSVLSMAMA